MKKLILFLTGMLPAILFAQEFKITGEIRPRFESTQGFKTLRPVDDDQDVWSGGISQRSRLNFLYTSKEDKIKTKVTLQDVRMWGNTDQLKVVSNTLDVHEAWGEIALSEAFALKVGRQEVDYDNARILGNVGWAQQARTHDLALFKYEAGFKLHAGLAYSQKEDPSYKAMEFVWFNKKFEDLSLSFLFLNNGKYAVDAAKAVDNKVVYSQTFGTFINYKKGKIGFTLSGYMQTGEAAKDVDLSAYNALGEVSFAASENISLLLGGEILSGTDQDDADKATKTKSFAPFYGTNHKFNGLQDFFYVGNHADNVGLVDLYAKLGFKQGKFNAGAHVHMFSAAAKVLDAEAKEMSKGLGTELDLTAGYKFSNTVSFAGGVSTLFATETMGRIKAGDFDKASNWAWLMITIKPTFFESK